MSYLFVTPTGSEVFELDTSVSLGRGATAHVHAINIEDRRYAVKLFTHPDRVDWQKITAMTELGHDDDYDFVLKHAWPVAIIKKDGQSVGFAMPLYNLSDFKTLDYYFDNILRGEIVRTDNLALPNLGLIIKNLCIEIDKLHDKRIYLIDLKPQNIVINTSTNEVILLDCDSFSVESLGTIYPGTHVSPDYIAPEVTINQLSPRSLGIGQDLYGLAVLIFQLLNRGLHPFSGRLNIEINAFTNDDKAAEGHYAYGSQNNPNISPHVSSFHEMWPDEIVANFEACFTGGERPRANDWLKLIESIEEDRAYARCEISPNDPLHIKFRDKACMQCKAERLQAAHPPPPPIHHAPQESVERSYISPKQATHGNNSSGWVFFGIIGFIAFILFAANNEPDKSQSVKSNPKPPVLTCSNANPEYCLAGELCNRATFSTGGKKYWQTSTVFSGYVREAKRQNLKCDVQPVASSAGCSVTNLSACTSSRICSVATYPTALGMKWMSSSSLWVKEAKRRNLYCGVSEQSSSKCSNSAPKSCTDQKICSYATFGNPKKWNSSTIYGRNWVAEAKRRNLKCGVQPESINKYECSSTSPRLCPIKTVCSNATIGNPKRWKTTDIVSRRWVAEAERRNLNCGVPSNNEPKMYKYTDYSIIGNDLLANGIRDISEEQCVRKCLTYYNKRCKAVSYMTKWRSCWLKPSPNGRQRLKGVNTITIEH